MQYLHEEIEVRVNCFQFVLFSVLPSVEFVALFENRERSEVLAEQFDGLVSNGQLSVLPLP